MKGRELLITFFFLLASLEGFAAVVFMFTISAESEKAFLFNFSFQRLILIFSVSLVSFVLLTFGLWSWRKKEWAKGVYAKITNKSKINTSLWSLGCLFIVGLIGTLLPSYYLGRLEAHHTRLYPVIVWITLVGAQTFFPLLFIRGVCWQKLKEQINFQRSIVKNCLIVLIIFIAIWMLIALTKIGISPDIDFWNEGGVPLLGLQVVAALIIGILIFIATQKFEDAHFCIRIRDHQFKIAVLDILLIFLIWVGAVLVWDNEPIRRSYFTAIPTSPNYEYYPFSDAAVYDVGGQYVLIGKGINNGQFTDKPLYMLFLALLHALSGQDYLHIIRMQILCLAFFPVILYLLGKGIHGRLLGILVAILGIFKERNAIAATLIIQVSHSKILMSELSTALLLTLLTLLIFKWFKEAQGGRNITLLSGGILGAAALLRPNPLLLLPLILIVAVFVYKYHWRQWLISSSIFILGFVLVFSPWTISARDQDGDVFLLKKINGILRRYKKRIPVSSHQSNIRDIVTGFGLSSQQNDQDVTISGLFGIDSIVTSAKNFPLSLSNYRGFLTQFSSTTSAPRMQQNEFDEDEPFPSSAVYFMPAHFIHNQITAILILPISFHFLDLYHTLDLPMWDLQWDGRLSLEGKFLLLINLTLIALGIAVAWNHHKWAGLIPVIVNFGYYLANAIARTSGSRYLVPADWTIFLYYSLGLVQITYWLVILLGKSWDIHVLEENQPTLSTTSGIYKIKMAGTVVGLLILGLALPMSGKVIQPVYPEENKRTTLKTINQLPIDTPIAIKDLEAFIKQKNARAIYGRVLYPRFYPAGKGGCYRCVMIDYAYTVKDYPRLSMTVIGPYNASVILPLPIPPKSIPDGSDVYVIGCGSGYKALFNARIIDALMVIIVGEERNTVYIRSPIPKTFECPMR